MITIKKLHKSFGKLEVLKGIGLDFNLAGITAVLGPNGSGKTTLLKCVLGMVIPTKGLVTFQGKNVKNRWDYRNYIGYLPQIARFPENLTINELLGMVSSLRNQAGDSRSLIQRFQLEPFLNQRFRNLSGGTRQKANLVLTLMYDSPVLILDEPTAGLDPVALIELKQILQEEKAKGKIILITTHIMSLVEELADEVVFLLDGHIHFQGSIATLKGMYQAAKLETAIADMLKGNLPANGHIFTPKNHIRSCSKSLDTAFMI